MTVVCTTIMALEAERGGSLVLLAQAEADKSHLQEDSGFSYHSRPIHASRVALIPVLDLIFMHAPNSIPEGERTTNILFSALLFAYGSYGIWVNDLYIPGRRSRGVHLHDVPAWIMYGAMICACLVMLSVVLDHYDRRNNERHYRAFATAGKYIGWGLFGLSLFWD